MNLNKIISIYFLIIFFGCYREKEVHFDIPYEGDQLVFYGLLSNNIVQKIEFDITKPVLSDIHIPQKVELRASLFANNNFVGDFDTKNNSGIFLNNINSEKEYHIEIESELGDFKTTSINLVKPIRIAESTFLLTPNDIDIELELESFTDTIYLTFSFDYYKEEEILDLEEEFSFQYSKIKVMDMGRTKVNIKQGLWKTLFDENNNYLGVEKADKLKVKIFSVSKEVYTFYRSVLENRGTLGENNVEKKSLWSNIEGCYGFFGSYYVDSLVLKF